MYKIEKKKKKQEWDGTTQSHSRDIRNIFKKQASYGVTCLLQSNFYILQKIKQF